MIPGTVLTAIRAIAVAAFAFIAAPLPADAQPAGKTWRIGYLGSASPSLAGPFVEAFRQGLREHGYVEGKNLTVEFRWAHGTLEALPGLATELISLKVDAIFVGNTVAALAAMKSTKTIPIVFAGVGDPVAAGLVPNLARPGGNVTGLSTANIELVGKRLQLISEVTRATSLALGVVFNPEDASNVIAVRELKAPARAMGIALRVVEVRRPEDFERAFAKLRLERVDAAFVAAGALTTVHAVKVVRAATASGLPAIYGNRIFVDNGGLISYAADLREPFRRAGGYLDRILKGARPGDLPVEQPTKFELAINMKAARALGLTVPLDLLARADHIIE